MINCRDNYKKKQIDFYLTYTKKQESLINTFDYLN